jgi:hypothetical protein
VLKRCFLVGFHYIVLWFHKISASISQVFHFEEIAKFVTANLFRTLHFPTYNPYFPYLSNRWPWFHTLKILPHQCVRLEQINTGKNTFVSKFSLFHSDFIKKQFKSKTMKSIKKVCIRKSAKMMFSGRISLYCSLISQNLSLNFTSYSFWRNREIRNCQFVQDAWFPNLQPLFLLSFQSVTLISHFQNFTSPMRASWKN